MSPLSSDEGLFNFKSLRDSINKSLIASFALFNIHTFIAQINQL